MAKVAKTASVVSIDSSDAHGFYWVWRSADGQRQSRASFVYFYECVQDARRAGYAVDLSINSGKSSDLRNEYALR